MDAFETDVREAFRQVNEMLAGRQADVVIAALQDLLAATLCAATSDKTGAKELCAAVAKDLQGTIDKNFDHYHDPKNQRAAPRLGIN